MHTPSLLLFGLLASTIAAQNVIPSSATVFDANSQSLLPFVYVNGTRVQMVYRSDQVCNVSASLQGIALRRDMQDNRDYAAQSVGPCDLYVGYCGNAPGTLSTTFASNVAGTPTQVLSGVTLNLPAQPPAQVFAPFNLTIPFPTPFAYLRANGHLLLDYQVPGRATRKLLYPLDGAFTGSEGNIIQVGDLPTMSTGEMLNFYGNASLCVPGGQLELSSTGLRQNYTALLMIGTSSDNFLGLWLPFDMTPLGAPGSVLYTNVDAVLPFPITSSGTTYRGNATLPVPSVQYLAGKNLFAQTAFVDISNALGVVLSPMVAVTIGGTLAAPVVDSIVASDSSLATGFHLIRGTIGPVTRFDGSFN